MISRGSRFTRLFELLPWSLRRVLAAVAVVTIGLILFWATADASELSDALWLVLAVVVMLGFARLLRVRDRSRAARHRKATRRLQEAAGWLQSGTLLSRLTAINTIEQIGGESATHHSRMVKVLTAFLRETAVWMEPEDKGVREEISDSYRLPTLCRPDVQRALHVVGRSTESDPGKEGDVELNLSRIDLRMVGLVETHLEGANLQEAHLEGAELWRAHLEEADLSRVHLDGANLAQAHLQNANLEEAHLPGADLQYANLQGAQLGKANLSGARLTLAHLEGADLSSAIGLTSSQLREAYLDGDTRIPNYIGDLHQEGW